MSEIRLIIMDLDGTLLLDDGTVSPENRQALLDAQKRGVTIAVCSGRYCENASLVFLENGLSGPVVGSNGAQMMDTPMGTVRWKRFMAPASAARVRDTLDGIGAEYFLFADELVVTSNPAARHHSELSMGKKITELSAVRFGHGREAVDEALKRGIYKFYVRDNGDLPGVRRLLAGIPDANVTSSEPWNLEVMASGVDKGAGLTGLAAYLGLTPDQVMAFGDQENDLPMLTAAGVGVAMGNADEIVLEKAPYHTLTNNENGVAAFVRRMIG